MDVCYFVHEFGGVRGIEFGTIDCEDLGYVFVQRYVRKDNRIINGIPVDEFDTTKWKKLPKGFDGYFDADHGGFLKITYEELPELKNLRIDCRTHVAYAIERGLFVPKREFPEVKFEWNRSHEYRIVKSYPAWTITYGQDHCSYAKLRKNKVFRTYEDAKKELARGTMKKNKESTASDYELSISEARKTIRHLDPVQRMRIMTWFLSQPGIEDLVLRRIGNYIEYRYDRYHNSTKWKTIPVYPYI